MVFTDKLTDIADAIRVKTGKSELIEFNNFKKEVLSIDRLKRMTMFPDGLERVYFGAKVAQIAASYHYARKSGIDTFAYSTNSLFSAGVFPDDNRYVRDVDGNCVIDCSTFVGLALRGIPYEKSPYALHKGSRAVWNPSEELPAMYGTDGWEFTWFDKQIAGGFNDVGIDGHTTIRYAADFAEYFYKYGFVVYDSVRDGEFSAEITEKLYPGDLLFWAKSSANEAQKNRFRSISHVGIVAEKTSGFYEANNLEDVLYIDSIEEEAEELVMICRPDYSVKSNGVLTPLNVNLLSYPWSYSFDTEFTNAGITLKVTALDTINVSGTSTSTAARPLKGATNDRYGCLKLSAGSYQLSGMDGSGIKSTSFALQARKFDGTDFSPSVRCYDGHVGEFTLTEDTYVAIFLYVSNGREVSGFDLKPSLVRVS